MIEVQLPVLIPLALGTVCFKLCPYVSGEDIDGNVGIVDGSNVLDVQALLWKC